MTSKSRDTDTPAAPVARRYIPAGPTAFTVSELVPVDDELVYVRMVTTMRAASRPTPAVASRNQRPRRQSDPTKPATPRQVRGRRAGSDVQRSPENPAVGGGLVLGRHLVAHVVGHNYRSVFGPGRGVPSSEKLNVAAGPPRTEIDHSGSVDSSGSDGPDDTSSGPSTAQTVRAAAGVERAARESTAQAFFMP